MEYEIITDSCCNLTSEQIEKLKVHILPLYNIVDGVEKANHCDESDDELKAYYDLLRSKTPVSTSCASKDACEPIIRKLLDEGKSLLYIGFSSALSATYSVVSRLFDEMRPLYPKQKLYCVDSLCACCGQGLLVNTVAELKEKGTTIDSAYDWAQDNKYKICHLFTLDTLAYAYKGGRIKKSSFLLANTLNIKPLMHVDNAGTLTAFGKVFGRKSSLNALAKKTASTIINPKEQTIFIGHADCPKDAQYLLERLKEYVEFKDVQINCINLVIGSHSGPGTVAVFYYGNNRNV